MFEVVALVDLTFTQSGNHCVPLGSFYMTKWAIAVSGMLVGPPTMVCWFALARSCEYQSNEQGKFTLKAVNLLRISRKMRIRLHLPAGKMFSIAAKRGVGVSTTAMPLADGKIHDRCQARCCVEDSFATHRTGSCNPQHQENKNLSASEVDSNSQVDVVQLRRQITNSYKSSPSQIKPRHLGWVEQWSLQSILF